MNGYSFALSCPACGRECVHGADGNSDGFNARAVAVCRACHRTWLLTVTLTSAHSYTPTTASHEPPVVRDMDAPFAGLIDLLMESA